MQRRSASSDADRRGRQADRLARVLKVLELIQGHGRWSPAALAKELDCSERTIHRYLEVLAYAGVPYSFDRAEGAYRVRADFRFPVLNLNEDELLGQALASSITSSPGLDVATGGKRTTEKIAASAGENAQRLLRQAAELVKVL